VTIETEKFHSVTSTGWNNRKAHDRISLNLRLERIGTEASSGVLWLNNQEPHSLIIGEDGLYQLQEGEEERERGRDRENSLSLLPFVLSRSQQIG
jgi:hypothetical protein